ncbi:hypothetical protein A7981_10020 [Methylovorus sp. MM2]|uniref:DUF4870 domain-containing protein n=1 Tax=Methylovorus sp. MM2 TaxID=1848038 RepID=UPI0007E2A671|nr:DUF4870 domain-containing protein [Methylovorus sp. MM2]OAM51792.1 hypothetical protein A7981_10020 [Methylovorus sp. MM2]
MADIENMDVKTVPSPDDKNIAVLTHLGGALFSVIPSLIVWLLKKDDNAYIGEQAREALNFQITMLIANVISGFLMVILIGFLLFSLIWIANIIFCIVAAVACSKGDSYKYPFSLRLIS